MSLLRLEAIRVGPPGAPRLQIPELGVEAGEVLVILGATGAGKSTLLRVMGLVQRPEAGRVRWREAPLPWPPPLLARRRLTMAFQDPLLFAGNVADNVGYGLRLRGLPREERHRRVEAALRLMQIEALAGRDARTLSGGEAHRASLARALVLEPELLLLDEPLTSLDEGVREKLLGDLIGSVRARGLTCVFVTHDQAEAVSIADRIAVVEKGRLAQLGSPDEVFYRPRRASVARLLRTENLLEGRLTRVEDGLASVAVGERAIQVVSGLPVGTRVIACLRPEEIVVSPAGPPPADSARNHLPGTIRAVLPLGATVKITVDCGMPLVVLVTRRSGQELGLAVGSAVSLSFKATAVHLIPAETGGSP